jgi:hypothetical protein
VGHEQDRTRRVVHMAADDHTEIRWRKFHAVIPCIGWGGLLQADDGWWRGECSTSMTPVSKLGQACTAASLNPASPMRIHARERSAHRRAGATSKGNTGCEHSRAAWPSASP